MFRQVESESWVNGNVALRVADLSLGDVLISLSGLMPGDWALPDDVAEFDVLALDRGALNLGFWVEPEGPDSLYANVTGTGHLTVGTSDLIADGMFVFRRVDDQQWTNGELGLRVEDLTLTDVLVSVSDLMPGEWSLPEGITSFDALALDRAALTLGFWNEPDDAD